MYYREPMRRVLVRRPGGHEALELVEERDPTPGPGEARVRVAAAGVNFADTLVRLGRYEAARGLYPITPGFEVAGVVDAVGAGVERVKAAFDANGLTTPRPAFDRLRPGGRLVIYGFAELLPRGTDRPWLPRLALNYLRLPRFSPFELTAANRSVMGFNVVFLFHKLELAERAMEDVLRWIAEGRIAKVPVTEFPAERVADAHAALESGRTTGKLVLVF